MTVVSLKTGNPGTGSATQAVIKLEFSDGSSLLFTKDYLPDALLSDGEKNAALWAVGRELSDGEEEIFLFAAACYRAERIALRLIARAEQNSLGLMAKLERRGIDADAAKTVVSCLLDKNLLDDKRYAEYWLHSRLALRTSLSPRLLLIALGKRGIDRESSRDTLDKVLDPETEYALLLRYLEKARLSEDKERSFLRAQLKYEGFSFSVLNRYFDK